MKWSRIVSFLHLIFDKSYLQNKKAFQYSGMIELQDRHHTAMGKCRSTYITSPPVPDLKIVKVTFKALFK